MLFNFKYHTLTVLIGGFEVKTFLFKKHIWVPLVIKVKTVDKFFSFKLISLWLDWQDQSVANLPLIQIATDENIYLFHRLTRLPPSLRKLFENEKIKKVGVAISGDLAKISRKFEIEAKGGEDLRSIRNESGSLEEMARE